MIVKGGSGRTIFLRIRSKTDLPGRKLSTFYRRTVPELPPHAEEDLLCQIFGMAGAKTNIKIGEDVACQLPVNAVKFRFQILHIYLEMISTSSASSCAASKVFRVALMWWISYISSTFSRSSSGVTDFSMMM